MLINRTISYSVCRESHQNTFLNHPSLPKVGRQSNRQVHDSSNGPYKLHRFGPGWVSQSLFDDQEKRSLTPSQTPLTTPKTACPRTCACGHRQCITGKLKKSSKQLVALVPASLGFICKERVCEVTESSLPRKSNNVELERVDLSLDGRLERGDDSDPSSNGDLHFSSPDCSSAFVAGQGAHDQGNGTISSGLNFEPHKIGSTCPSETVESGKETTLRKIWRKKKERRRMRSLLLVNVLAALYGSSNVASGIVTDATPSLPASLTSLVQFTSALIFFSPALMSALKSKDMGLLRAGAELGGLTFAATAVDSCNPSNGSSSSSAALLFAFTVIFVPFMELCAGRQSGSRFNLIRFATLAAISGMGLLEEEGFGWRGISCPQIDDLWGMAVSIISAVHIFRSEALGGHFDPLRLNAVQCGVLTILSLGWETFGTFKLTALRSNEVIDQIQCLPWAPLIYNGLVCFGLCSWLELHGLRSIHASTATLVYTTIPVWGAFLSFFAHHETPGESATIGAVVIMVTSIYAQMTTRSVDIRDLRAQSKSFMSTSSNPDEQEGPMWNDSRLGSGITAKDELKEEHKSADYFPGALLTSQLKFPSYAAQAKMLLADVKIKLGALKSILFTTVSSSIMTSTTGTSNPPSSVNPATGRTSPAGAPSNVTGSEANSLAGSSHSSSTVTAHMKTLDVSTAHHIAPHGHTVVGPLSFPGSDIFSAAAHTTDSTIMVLKTHALIAVTTGFESALVAVGYDIILGFEEAKDAVTSLESFIQFGVGNTTHTVAACISGAAALVSNFSSNLAESAPAIHRLAESANFTLPSHLLHNSHNMVADGVTDVLFHNVLPVINDHVH